MKLWNDYIQLNFPVGHCDCAQDNFNYTEQYAKLIVISKKVEIEKLRSVFIR